MEKDIITATLPDKRTRGRLKRSWMNNMDWANVIAVPAYQPDNNYN